MNTAYEVILAPAATRAVLGLGDPSDLKELADALRTELAGGPNAHKEIRFDAAGNFASSTGGGSPGAVYTATPLSSGGYTAIHRPMTAAELRRLRSELGRRVSRSGFYVLDLLPPEAGFIGRIRLF